MPDPKTLDTLFQVECDQCSGAFLLIHAPDRADAFVQAIKQGWTRPDERNTRCPNCSKDEPQATAKTPDSPLRELANTLRAYEELGWAAVAEDEESDQDDGLSRTAAVIAEALADVAEAVADEVERLTVHVNTLDRLALERDRRLAELEAKFK